MLVSFMLVSSPYVSFSSNIHANFRNSNIIYISTLSVFWDFHFIAVPPSGNLIAFLFLLKPAAFLLPEVEIVITLKQIVTLIKEMSMLFF